MYMHAMIALHAGLKSSLNVQGPKSVAELHQRLLCLEHVFSSSVCYEVASATYIAVNLNYCQHIEHHAWHACLVPTCHNNSAAVVMKHSTTQHEYRKGCTI
jgi:hypothetical protein